MKGGLRQSVLLQEGKKKLEMEKLCLIDVSLEDDSLIPPTTEEQCTSDGFQISELVDDGNRQEDKPNNSRSAGMNRELSPMSEDPSQPKRTRRVGQCNLRRSLAWDKAFFTNQGVLNPEELSLINTTFKKPREQLLPGIEEEMITSMESNASMVGDNLTLQDLEEKLFEQTQTLKQKADGQADETHNVASICNRARAGKQKPDDHDTGTHAVPYMNDRKGGSKQISENADNKANGVASISNRIGGNKRGKDKVGPKLSTQQQRSLQPKTKPLMAAKRHSMNKVVESTTQKGSHLQLPTSLTVRKSSIKSKEELQKPLVKQPKGTFGNNGSSAPTSLTKKISSVSKCVKDKLGKVLPANMGRPQGNRISPGNVKDDSIVSGISTPSSNSSVSESPCSAKLSRCHSFTSYQRFAKPVSDATPETNVGINYCMLDVSDTNELSAYVMDGCNSKHCSSTSPGSSLDGMSSASSPTFSNNSMASHSQSSSDNVLSDNQFTSTTNMSSSTESQISECSRQSHGVQNNVPGRLTLANIHVPAKDGSNRACSIARHWVASDGLSNNGSSQSKAYRSRPSGLRLPSPKIGFFDAASVPVTRNPSSSHEKSIGYGLDKKLLPYSGLHYRPPRFIPGGPGSIHQDCRPKASVVRSIRPPSFASASHSRPDALLKSFIPSSPAQPFQTQLNSNPGASTTMSLLVQQNPGSFCKDQQVPFGQSSNGEHHSLDSCKKAAPIVEDVQRKLCLRMDSSDTNQHNEQGSSGSVVGARQCQLGILDRNSALQDGSEALDCEPIYTNCTEAMIATETDKAFDPSTDINVKCDDSQGPSFLADDTVRSFESNSIKLNVLRESQREIENATERDVSGDLYVSASTGTEIACPSFQNEQEVDACHQVSQAFEQNGHLGKLVESRISHFDGILQLKPQDKSNPIACDLSDSALDCLNTTLSNSTDPFRSPSQHAAWPVYQDIVSESEEKSNEKIDSSVASMGFYQQSVSSGGSVESNPMHPVLEIKTCGRIPLAANCALSSSIEWHELQKQPISENDSVLSSAKKVARRLASLPTSAVLADISGQENSASTEKYSDSPSYKNRRWPSHDPSDEKGDTKNLVDNSLFSEENFCMPETTDMTTLNG